VDIRLICPKCGSDDIFLKKTGECMCGECGARFSAPRQQTATDNELLSGTTATPMRVFISYAHAQSAIVDLIVEGLTRRGHDVWFDKKDIRHGNDWREAITKGIAASNGVISFLSREAVREKGVCLDELSIAVGVKYGNIHTVLLHKEDEVRPPAQLTHRQWLDMSAWQEMLNRGEEEFRPWFNEKLASIIRVIESPESQEFVGKIATIREKLQIGSIAVSRQNWYLSQKYVGREWLTQAVEQWLDDPDGGQLCAIYGGPGTGKSAFAAQYAYRSPRVAASIFFEHGNEHFNSAGALIRELVFQLACRLSGYRDIIYYMVTSEDGLMNLNDRELFNRLLTVPLASYTINGNHDTLCIVVDGLDECTSNEKNQVARLLGEYAGHFPEWLKLIVLSRSESAVTGWLEPDAYIDLMASDDENMSDIRKYYEERLEDALKDVQDREGVLDALTERTEGVFLYAYVVSGMILDGKMDISDTGKYPQGLNRAFRAWFARYFPDVNEYRRLYQLCLGMIAASHEPIPLDELDVVNGWYDPADGSFRLNFEPAQDDKWKLSRQKLLERLAPLLQYRENDMGETTVAFSHRYIAEWLTGRDQDSNNYHANVYACDPRDALRAMERTWRHILDNGGDLSQYQALYMHEYTFAAEDELTASATAQNGELISWLVSYGKVYMEHLQFDTAIGFYLANAERAKYVFDCCPSDECELELANALSLLAEAHDAGGTHHDALEFRELVLEIYERIEGTENVDTARAMNNLASTYSQLGRLDEAAELHKDSYEITARILGPEEDETLSAQNNMALSYSDRGMYDEALAMFEQLLDARRRVSGADNTQTLTVEHNLAALYNSLGRYEEALKLAGHVVEIRTDVLGGEHPETILAENNLADILDNIGRCEEARKLWEETLEKAGEVLGDTHPTTLMLTNNLGVLYAKLWMLDEAEELLSQTMEARIEVLGMEHPDTLQTMANLASVYGSRGMYREAAELNREVLDARRRLLSPEHPDVLRSMNNLALALEDLNLIDEPLELLQECLETRIEYLGPEHPDTVLSMHNLSQLYLRLNRYEEALTLSDRALAIAVDKLGSNHPDTLTYAAGTSAIYHELEMYEEALELRRIVYYTRKLKRGPAHPETLTAMNNLASTYSELGMEEEAVALEEEALELSISSLGRMHPDTLVSVNNLAVTYSNLGRLEEALELEEALLNDRIEVLGEDHPSTIITMLNLAYTYEDLDRIEESLELREQAAQLSLENENIPLVDALEVLHDLADTYMELEMFDDARRIDDIIIDLTSEDDPEQ